MNPITFQHNEMERRISSFETECDTAIKNILQLKTQARSFLTNLPLGRELKEKFLSYTEKLNEYWYCVTEFNLTLNSLEKEMKVQPESNINKNSVSQTSLENDRQTTNSLHTIEHTKQTTNVNFHTHETSPTIQIEPCKNMKLIDRENEDLLAGSPRSMDNIEFEDDLKKEMTESTVPDPEPVAISLPPQPKLNPGSVLRATIMTVDGANLWLVEDAGQFVKLTEDMTKYYKKHQNMYEGEIPPFNFCAYFDKNDTESYFRALHITTEMDAVVHLVDTGESRSVPPHLLRRLAPAFSVTPPLARCCHLPGIELPDDDYLLEKQTEFLNKYLWQQFTIKLEDIDEDDEMESLGVYIYFEDGTTINDRLVQELFSDSNSPQDLFNATPSPKHIGNGTQQLDIYEQSPLSRDSVEFDDELTDNPEYENPVEAVTGYDNRDEADICKHYKGGKSCFKGDRCKKRHVTIHPDGWTLDRVEVAGKIRAAVLPAPGTWHKVKVTHVVDGIRFYVHFENGDEPMTLADLVEEMTRVGANAGRLKLDPAIGELVSARFTDGRWYRARVTGHTDRGTVEVLYIDFGNESEVSGAEMTSLEPRWLSLPAQAAPCRLAGVGGVPSGKDSLREIVLDKIMKARIIARGYDELTVELLDPQGFSVAEQLCLISGTTLESYEVEDDSRRLFLHVPA